MSKSAGMYFSHMQVCACTRVGCGNYSTSVSVIVPTVPPLIGNLL